MVRAISDVLGAQNLVLLFVTLLKLEKHVPNIFLKGKLHKAFCAYLTICQGFKLYFKNPLFD